MANLVLLVLCFFVGVIARRSRTLPEDSHRVINAWVMFVSLPALVFRAIHSAAIDARLLASAGLLWLIFFIPAGIVWWRIRNGGSREWGAVALCAGLGNTAFVGLPLIEAVVGREALGAAAVVDQLGTFLALFLFAIPWATAVGGGSVSLGATLLKLLRAPGIVALALAVALRPFTVPAPVDAVLLRLAEMMSPLALASVGWQLDLSAIRGNGRRIALGLGWKLVLAPALVLALLLLWQGPLDFTAKVVVLQAAMAPMVTAGVIASDHKLSPALASALIAVGVPLSLLTVPLWWLFLK